MWRGSHLEERTYRLLLTLLLFSFLSRQTTLTDVAQRTLTECVDATTDNPLNIAQNQPLAKRTK
ncbi:hypothetical protein GCM10009000_067260 [Halobacterium noricense]